MRFQDFFTLNCNQLVHYASISKELHGQGVPIFIRCIGIDSAGPVHSIMLHNIAMYFPGMFVCAPTTPGEYLAAWDFFIRNDQPLFVSEHRRTYPNAEEWENEDEEEAKITLYGISDARIEMMLAAELLRGEGLRVNVRHIMFLKPFDVETMKQPLLASRKGLVIDNGFPNCGAARSIAYELAESTGLFVNAFSSADNVKCFNPAQQNKTPSAAAICAKVHEIIGIG
jgi:pyruvate/2-oxoglutarate/acetoin dehydrogenase E1 component